VFSNSVGEGLGEGLSGTDGSGESGDTAMVFVGVFTGLVGSLFEVSPLGRQLTLMKTTATIRTVWIYFVCTFLEFMQHLLGSEIRQPSI